MPSLIGNKPNQVPSNGDLGTMAFRDQDQFYPATQTMGFKNRIINGAMMIDQRNAGASVTPTTTAYTLDRWQATVSASSKFSVQQNAGSVTPPSGFTQYLGCTSLSAYSVSSSDYFLMRQAIEGFNIADLGWGTANAQPVTISFRVYSSLTGTFGGAVENNASNRSYPFSYTVSAANTWETKTVTIAGDTSGTWLSNNGIGLILAFSLGAGSTLSGTAGAWGSTRYFSATGAVSVVGTSGATFYITGVQLEKGSTATSFDYRPYGTELSLCQRYFTIAGGGGSDMYAGGNVVYDSASVAQVAVHVPVTLRATPSITVTGSLSALGNGSFPTLSSTPTSIFLQNPNIVRWKMTGSLSSNQVYLLYTASAANYVSINSEL